jgi:hypothetical protein
LTLCRVRFAAKNKSTAAASWSSATAKDERRLIAMHEGVAVSAIASVSTTQHHRAIGHRIAFPAIPTDSGQFGRYRSVIASLSVIDAPTWTLPRSALRSAIRD